MIFIYIIPNIIMITLLFGLILTYMPGKNQQQARIFY